MKTMFAALLCLALPLAAQTDSPERLVARDLRTVATALESRATDTNEYPNVSFNELVALLVPTYAKTLPLLDPWGTPFWYVGDGKNYRFVSAGADRRFEPGTQDLDARDQESRPMDSLDADIIFQNGTFLQYPRSIRQDR